ncbi:MAG TPA: hypothetical protein VM166_05960 [Gemmatimonadaceae bacterium]|nr:hypothetical protein [Gemmatimonadaceae bacterium]
MIVRFLQYSKPLVGAAIVSAIAGCSSDMTGANRHPVQFSFTTKATVVPAANAVAADLIVGPANELVLTKVQLVFRKIELDRSGTSECIPEAEDADDDNAHHTLECEDVLHEPIVVNVPVDDALHPVINVPLPAGTYSELEAKLSPARDRSTAFNAANPDLVGKSVRVEGTFKGNPFVFTSAVRRSLEIGFDPPLVIDETTRNATVSFDVRKWFLNSSGQVIDPTTAAAGTPNLERIEDNIRRSFHAFEDDEERGEDHHEGHNGNDDSSHH